MGGYLNIVTDRSSNFYLCFYKGQSNANAPAPVRRSERRITAVSAAAPLDTGIFARYDGTNTMLFTMAIAPTSAATCVYRPTRSNTPILVSKSTDAHTIHAPLPSTGTGT